MTRKDVDDGLWAYEGVRRPGWYSMAQRRSAQANTEAIAKLATLLAEEKIDLPTYQASIVALTKKNEPKTEVVGYR